MMRAESRMATALDSERFIADGPGMRLLRRSVVIMSKMNFLESHTETNGRGGLRLVKGVEHSSVI